MVITSEGLGYFHQNDDKTDSFRQYNPFTANLSIVLNNSNEIEINFYNQSLKVKTKTSFGFVDTLRSFIFGIKKSSLNSQNRYQSFSKVVTGNKIRFFVNGGFGETNYFSYLFATLELAQKEILITDWFLTPSILMNRPATPENHSEIFNVLLNACKRGVKVYIILYEGVARVTYQNSTKTKNYLQGLHANFMVATHPGEVIRLYNDLESS